MNSKDIKAINLSAEILMYGHIILEASLEDNNGHIVLASAPDGYADDIRKTDISASQFGSIAQAAVSFLENQDIPTEEGSSNCSIIVMDKSEEVQSYNWPDTLSPVAFKGIADIINIFLKDEILADFLEMFY